MSKEINFEEKSGLGIITLTRPDVLNALSCEMCHLLDEKLKIWQDNSSIKAVIIKGAGNKAFCAGGDVRAIVEQGSENNSIAKEFFATEYRMNARIFHFEKPFIALLDGIVMGGGVGVSIHGSHRIITENTLFAMPESAIGLIPDVGGSYFLPRMPGALGTAYMRSDKLNDFVIALADGEIKSHDDVDAILAEFADDPGSASLDEFRDLIDAAFGENTIEDIFEHLSIIDHNWARETHAVLSKMSPISLKVILEQIQRGAKLKFDDCMIMEYRIVSTISSYDSDFYEGVRAVLIDKDHNPKWVPGSSAEVSNEMVLAHFEMPVEGDLVL
jgi:enoyl-CoA hydratase